MKHAGLVKFVPLLAALAAGAALSLGGLSAQAQEDERPVRGQRRAPPLGDQKPLYENLADSYITRPLLPYQQKYAKIDGKHLLTYVDQITAIARRDRDRGTQDWGMLTGKIGDRESADWMLAQFRRIGLTDVHLQPIDVPPVWSNDSWKLVATGAGKSVTVTSGVPTGQRSTPAGGVDAELTYLGTGTAADFIGRDVRGKAVVIYTGPPPANSNLANGAIGRAKASGAVALLTIVGIPGNVSVHSGGGGGGDPNAPYSFTIGNNDGDGIRRLIEQAPAGQPPKIHIEFSGKIETGLKTADVFGVLPGMTDEKIIVIGHRNSWFEGSVDNASGQAAMLGLAEYYAKIPKAQRRRTMIFVGPPGHHRGGTLGMGWVAAHPESVGGFDKVALIINAEHVARVESYLYDFAGAPRQVIYPNQAGGGYYWFVGGSPVLKSIVGKSFKDFGIPVYNIQFGTGGDGGPVMGLAPSIQIIDAYTFFHTDAEGPDKVPYTGLENITRAYANVIDEANKQEKAKLVWVPPAGAK